MIVQLYPPLHELVERPGGLTQREYQAMPADEYRRYSSIRTNRRTTAKGRDSWSYRKAKPLILAAFGYRCAECGRGGPLHRHRTDGGYHDGDLLAYVALCPACHGARHP